MKTILLSGSTLRIERLNASIKETEAGGYSVVDTKICPHKDWGAHIVVTMAKDR